MTPLHQIPASVVAILCALVAGVAFSINDLGVKMLSGDYPLHQVVLIRASIGICFTLAMFMPLEGGYANLKTNHLALHMLRGLFVVFANMMFFLGLAAIPLSEATAIFFVSPLVITLFSVIFLGERVGLWRWVAVAAGLAGVIIMLRPGAATFQFAALLPLAAAVGYASLHILTRKMGVTERASTMAFYIQLTFMIVSSCIGLLFGDGRYAGTGDPSVDFLMREWTWPKSGDLAIMAGIGVASGIGGYMISQAYRLGEAAMIAPFEYISLVLAIVWSIVIFNEFPDMIAWLGITLIFGGGLLVFWRESILKRRLAAARPTPIKR